MFPHLLIFSCANLNFSFQRAADCVSAASLQTLYFVAKIGCIFKFQHSRRSLHLFGQLFNLRFRSAAVKRFRFFRRRLFLRGNLQDLRDLLTIVFGTIPCISLYFCWISLRRSVSRIAFSIDGVTVSAYMMTCPPHCGPRAQSSGSGNARLRKNPSLSAVKNRDKGHLRDIQPFAQQVDAHQDVKRRAAGHG